MLNRGRKNHTSNVVQLDVTGLSPATRPPSELSASDRVLFKEIMASLDTRAVATSDMPLFISYVQTVGIVRKLAAKVAKKPEPSMVAAFDKMLRVQASLATRLRLSPQSRLDRKQAGRMAAKQQETQPAQDWMKLLDDDD